MQHYNPFRKPFIIGTAFLFLGPVTAQPVFIPDANLRNELNAWVPGCVDGTGFLDPDLPAVQSQAELQIHVRWTPADLTGIEALTNLTRLFIESECWLTDGWTGCWDNAISVPEWPANLHVLYLSYGTTATLPSFPMGLDTLQLIQAEGFTALPAFPDGLSSLHFDTPTGFTDIPVLPSSLVYMLLAMRTGQQVPVLPDGLQDLYIAGDPSASIPQLPPNLVTLYMDFLSGTTVTDIWPTSLTSIALGSMTDLAELPAAWPDGVQHVQLHGLPQINEVPPLPEGATSLWLGQMPITTLAPLPSTLGTLQLDELPGLHCLPVLPPNMTMVWIDAYTIPVTPSGVNCVPNFPDGADMRIGEQNISWDPEYLCNPLNSTCPFINPVATGTVYVDQDADGTYDPGEPGYPNAVINVEPGSLMFGTQPNGQFTLPMPMDLYTLSASSWSTSVLSISPATHEADLFDPSIVDADNDFGVVLQPTVQDLRVVMTMPQIKIGHIRQAYITYSNVGSTIMNGTVKLSLSSFIDYVSATVTPSNVNLNLVDWDFANLQPGEVRNIQFSFFTHTDVPIGFTVQSLARIDPLATDITPGDNVMLVGGPALSSFDPNDKTVVPNTLSPQQVGDGAELDYLIRFQNTGNTYAERIVITDTLSADLQWGTMRFIDSSHPCSWLLTGNGVLRFTFEPIILPDSTSDEPGSHGFVRFTMKPQPGLLLGATVENTANIYFDLNDPVITDPAVLTVDVTQGLAQSVTSRFSIAPNPVHDQLALFSEGEGAIGMEVEMIDASGRVVIRQRISGVRSVIDVSDLAAGVYVLRPTGPGQTLPLRFVKD